MAAELVIKAFLNKKNKNQNNTMSDGNRLYLHDNCIAEWRNDEIWITNAGWQTNVTKDRLNQLGANIYQRNFEWYFNNKVWDGNWIKL